MTRTSERPPAHVGTAFGVRIEAAEPLPEGDAWLCDGVVLRPVTDRASAVWLGQTFAALEIPGIRIVRPLGTTDGRQVVGGWVAYRSIDDAGRPSSDGLVAMSIRLHQALEGIRPPGFIAKANDVLARADRMAWGESSADALDEHRGGGWFEILAGSVKRVALPDQVVHADLYRCVRLADDAAMVVSEFRPFHRPAEWAAALVVVDAIAAGTAGAELITGWSHLPEWRQLLLRAMLFRLAAHALDERADDAAIDHLRRTAGIVSEFA